MRLFCLLAIAILLSFTSSAQEAETQPGLKRNVVYGTLGTIVLYAVANATYERMIIERNNKFISSYWVRLSGGTWGAWGPQGGSHYLAGFTALTGSKNSHIELHLGINTMFDKISYDEDISNPDFSNPDIKKTEYWDITPSGALGYRFQKPGGHFLFRAGFGFPETAYLSLGFCF